MKILILKKKAMLFALITVRMLILPFEITIIILVMLTFILLMNIPVVFAQPNTLWTKTFGGNDWDYGNSVQQTKDQGFIVTGTTYSFGAGNGDIWLVKTNSIGNEMWNKPFGGIRDEIGFSVQQTFDGGYVITGLTKSFGAGNSDVWLIKTDTNGNEEWSRTFGGSNDDIGRSVQQTGDGGYIILGETNSFGAGDSDAWLIKTDSSGNEVWRKTFGGNKNNSGESVMQTSDNGYIIAGTTASFEWGSNDVWLIKADSSGNKVWSQTFGGSNNDGSHSVQQTFDHGYIVTGWTWSFGKGNADLWLIKTDSTGNEIWNRTIGGSDHDDGSSVQQTMDGGFIITGWTESFGSARMNAWLVKTDANGNKIWSKAFGGNNFDMGYSVKQTADGGYIITGYTNSHSGGSDDDLWLIRLGPENTTVESKSEGSLRRFSLEQNYPNPFNPSTEIAFHISVSDNVRLEIYNVMGQKMATLVNEKKAAGSYKVRFEADGFPAGVYFCRLKAGKLEQVRKMVLLE